VSAILRVLSKERQQVRVGLCELSFHVQTKHILTSVRTWNVNSYILDAYFLASFRSTCTVIDFWSVKTPQSLCLVIFVSSPETPSWKKEKAAVLVHKKRKICLDREKVHPLHWLSSGYFEKLHAFCTLLTHFLTGTTDLSVCIERKSGHIGA
jgi:hypothetical protein